MSEGLGKLGLSTKGKTMDTSNLYYGDDFGYVDFDEEELTPEEQAEADKAYNRQLELEAYAEFLDAPNCFD